MYKWPSFAIHFKAVVLHCDSRQMTQTKLQRVCCLKRILAQWALWSIPFNTPPFFSPLLVFLCVSGASLVSRLHWRCWDGVGGRDYATHLALLLLFFRPSREIDFEWDVALFLVSYFQSIFLFCLLLNEDMAHFQILLLFPSRALWRCVSQPKKDATVAPNRFSFRCVMGSVFGHEPCAVGNADREEDMCTLLAVCPTRQHCDVLIPQCHDPPPPSILPSLFLAPFILLFLVLLYLFSLSLCSVWNVPYKQS